MKIRSPLALEQLLSQGKSDPPENSVELRVICCSLALISLASACHYTNVPPIPAVMAIWMTLSGSYISYYTRQTRNRLVTTLALFGLVVILAIFADELFVQFYSPHLDLLVPFVHVLAGLLALHTWDLRTRLDLNANAMIGMGVMCCTLVLGRDLLFGMVVCLYVWLCSGLLYCEAASRTKSNGRYTPTEPMSPSRLMMSREAKGSVLAPISTIPILGLVFFLCLPRVTSVFDALLMTVSRFAAPQAVPLPGGGYSGPLQSTTGGIGHSQDTQIRPAAPSQDGTGGPVMGVNGLNAKAKGGSKAPPELTAKAGDQPKTAEADQHSQGLPPESELFFRDKTAVKYDDQLIFKVSTPGEYYYRRLALDNYDGHKWTVNKSGMVSKCRKLNGGVYQELAGVPSLFLPPTFPSTEVTQEFTVCSNMGHIIPTVAVPQKIDFPVDPVVVDDNGIVKTDALLEPGMSYRVFSQIANYDIDSMRRTPDDSELTQRASQEYAPCLKLPLEVPEEVRELALNVAGKDGNWFAKSEHILKFLRTNYKYSLAGEDAPAKRDLVDAFLFGDSKTGGCGQFASAFTVMCRVNKIPARVVSGFAPGTYNSLTGVREVHGVHSHAWAEVWIPKWGWVPFDAVPLGVMPTPPEEDKSLMAQVQKNLTIMQAALNPPKQEHAPVRPAEQAGPNAVPMADAPQQYQNALPPGQKAQDFLAAGDKTGTTTPPGKPDAKGPTPSTSTSTSSATAQPAKPATEQESKTTSASTNTSESPHSKLLWWLQGFIIVGLIPMTLVIAQAIRSAYLHVSGLMNERKNAKPSTLLYLRLVDDLKRFKVSRSPSDTAEDFSERFLSAVGTGMPVHPELPILLERFMKGYADDRFGGPAGSEARRAELEEIGNQIRHLAKMKVS